MSSWQSEQVNRLNLEQLEQLKEIGAYLRQLRQEQSISIEEIASKTFIRLGLVKALEEGQSEQLPEPIFIQGLIRRYADALNVDGAAIAQAFPATPVMPVKPQDINQEIEAPAISFKAPSISFEPYLRQIKPYLGYALLSVAAIGGLLFLLSKLQTPQPTTASKSAAVVQQQASSKPVASPAKAKAPPQTAPIEVKVSLKDESWIEVQVDGKKEFEGIVKKEYRKTWTAKKELKIRAGNAGAVLVAYNRGEAKPIGKLGDSKTVTFKPKK